MRKTVFLIFLIILHRNIEAFPSHFFNSCKNAVACKEGGSIINSYTVQNGSYRSTRANSLHSSYINQSCHKSRIQSLLYSSAKLLDDWSLQSDGSLIGYVPAAHPSGRIADGGVSKITTSPLSLYSPGKSSAKLLSLLQEKSVISTSSGSKYRLGKRRKNSVGVFSSLFDRASMAIATSSSTGTNSIVRKKKNDLRDHSRAAAKNKVATINGDGKRKRSSVSPRFLAMTGSSKRSTSGKSQIWTAYRSSSADGTTAGPPLIAKISRNSVALERENRNYERVNEGFLFRGSFVKRIEYIPQCTDEHIMSNSKFIPSSFEFAGKSALVIESGNVDLKRFLSRRGGLSGELLKRAAVAAVNCVEAMHSAGMVWTDLKADNLVITAADSKSNSLGVIKGIDLESAMPVNSHPVDYSPEACPPEFAIALLDGQAEDFVLQKSYDMWGLGMFLYQLDTGRGYFGNKNPNDIIKVLAASRNRGNGRVFTPDFSAVNDSQLRNLIVSLCANDPKRRPRIIQVLLHPYFITSSAGSLAKMLSLFGAAAAYTAFVNPQLLDDVIARAEALYS
jgi:hypothetical protein